tara:strand:- start:136 stop:261 length:126 start_codon:yes stop_codon:yes gene_type:complete
MTNLAPPIDWRQRDEEDQLYAVRVKKLYSVGLLESGNVHDK